MATVTAIFGLNHKGDAYVAAFTAGGFLVGGGLAMIAMNTLWRVLAIATGPIAAFVFFLIKSPYELDAVAWLIILTTGVIGWFVGFAVGSAIRRAAMPTRRP
jgi:hypothetical protein